MGERSKIQWTNATWHEKSAARRLGISPEEYLSRIALGLKWCYLCEDWHSRYIFTIDRSRGDGLAASCRGRKPRPLPLSTEEKQKRARATYRAYYADGGGPRIRARVYARKRGCEPVDPLTREMVMEKFDGRCAYCQRAATTLDHVVPVIEGGGSRRGNLLPACVSCNSKKRARDLDTFLTIAPNPSDLIAEELCMEDVL